MLTHRIEISSLPFPLLSSRLLQYAHWLPAVPLIAYWAIAQFVIPLPFYAHYDPEMSYALSSLSVFNGMGYTYVDHPGTPLELIGSALYALTLPAVCLSGQPFAQFHVAHPEIFLGLARTFLALVGVLCAILLFRFALTGKSWLDLLVALTVSLSFFALHPLSFESLVTWSQNSFSFPFGTLLLLVLFVTVRTQGFSGKRACLLGFAAGVLTAAQLFFVTWTFAVALAFGILGVLENRNWRHIAGIIVLSGIASAAGFLAATLPILPVYDVFLGWVGRLLFQQGIYGSGPAGIASFESLSTHFLELWDILPILILATGAALFAVAVLSVLRRQSVRKDAGLWSVALALAIQLILTLALMLKHPGVYYMLGLAAIFPVLLLAIFALVDSNGLTTRLARSGVCILLLLGVAKNFRLAIDYQGWQQAGYAATADSIRGHLADYATAVGKDPDALVILWTYGVPSPCYARMFGNSFVADRALGPEIARVCPNQMEFNVWNQVMSDAAGTVQPRDLPWDVMIVNKTVADPGKWGGYGYLLGYGKTVTDNQNGLIFVLNQTVVSNSPK